MSIQNMPWHYWELSIDFKLKARLPHRLLSNCCFSPALLLHTGYTHAFKERWIFCHMFMPHRKIMSGYCSSPLYCQVVFLCSVEVVGLRLTAYPATPELTGTRNAFENKQDKKGWSLTNVAIWQQKAVNAASNLCVPTPNTGNIRLPAWNNYFLLGFRKKKVLSLGFILPVTKQERKYIICS